MIALTSGSTRAQLLPDGPGWLVQTGNGISWKDFFGEDKDFSCRSRPRDVDHLRRPPEILPRGLNQVERELLRCYEVRVRNVTDRPIQCTAVIEQVHVPGGAGERIEGVNVIYPRFNDVVVNLLVPVSRPPTKFSTQCFAIPATTPVYTQPTSDCQVDLTMPPAQDFAPESPPMFPESGEVLLEFDVVPGSDRLSNVRIVRTSRFYKLDLAALGVARESRARGGCAGTRYRQSVVFAAVHAPTQDRTTTAIVDVSSGYARQKGEARWNLLPFGATSAVCGLTGADRRIELGDRADKQPRANAEDCVATSAKIHNTSSAPIYCRAAFTLPQPDDSGRTEIRGERLVLPDAIAIVATVYADRAHKPPMPDTDCEIRDTPLPPQPPCDTRFLTSPNPNDFYPADSKAREEQGDVVLDFRIDSVAKKLRDIRIQQSSQYEALDLAALKVGQLMTATTRCPDVRRQAKVKFRLNVNDPVPAAN
ncbi:MAG TPA: TonB family protein [Steroidobacteraceae bacterium]|jgi:TonB family protein|nr:TonB family protein [Steroidobacteraceae bacterium]